MVSAFEKMKEAYTPTVGAHDEKQMRKDPRTTLLAFPTVDENEQDKTEGDRALCKTVPLHAPSVQQRR